MTPDPAAGVLAGLGVEPDVVAGALARIEDEALGEQTLFTLLLLATRSGLDLAGAARAVADGARLPTSPSDYERRVVEAEMRDVLDDG